MIGNKHPRVPTKPAASEATNEEKSPVQRRCTSPALNLKDVRFAWYTQEPRMWSSTEAETKHNRSTPKQVVAFLKLFIYNSFVLDKHSARYRDDALDTENLAEKAMQAFLQHHNVATRGRKTP